MESKLQLSMKAQGGTLTLLHRWIEIVSMWAVVCCIKVDEHVVFDYKAALGSANTVKTSSPREVHTTWIQKRNLKISCVEICYFCEVTTRQSNDKPRPPEPSLPRLGFLLILNLLHSYWITQNLFGLLIIQQPPHTHSQSAGILLLFTYFTYLWVFLVISLKQILMLRTRAMRSLPSCCLLLAGR